MTPHATLDEFPVPRREAAEIQALATAVGREALTRSPHLRTPDFTSIHPDDLGILVRACDRHFLDNAIAELLGPTPLRFRLSKRMTRSGGKTTRRQFPGNRTDYEIAVSTTILFDGFAEDDPDVRVAGLPCANRLEALQRIMEHEIVHLVEFLWTGGSNCRAAPFQRFAQSVFGHRSHTHELITRRQRAARQGIFVGTPVTFPFRGQRLAGRVNRITKRATVLVEDPAGDLYSDGKRYRKYYVPLELLKPVAGERARSPALRR